MTTLPSNIVTGHNYLEKKRQEYFDNLNAARVNNDIEYWVIFFLGAVIETAKKATRVFRSILDLKQEMDELLPEFGKRQVSVGLVIEHLFRNPVIVASRGFTIEGIAERTLRGILPLLVERSIIKEVTGKDRDRVYQFDRYLKLFKVEDEG